MLSDFLEYRLPILRKQLETEGGFYLTFLITLIIVFIACFFLFTWEFRFETIQAKEGGLEKIGVLVKKAEEAKPVVEEKPLAAIPSRKKGSKYLDGSMVDLISSSKGQNSALGNLLKEGGLGPEFDQELGKVTR